MKEYFAKHGLNAKRPPRPSKRTQQSVHKETKQTSTQAIPDMNIRAESLRASAEQSEPDSIRRSKRLRLKTLMCMYQAKAHAYEYGKSFPELY